MKTTEEDRRLALQYQRDAECAGFVDSLADEFAQVWQRGFVAGLDRAIEAVQYCREEGESDHRSIMGSIRACKED